MQWMLTVDDLISTDIINDSVSSISIASLHELHDIKILQLSIWQ